MEPFVPTRLCCGQKHFGPVCPDHLVMCCHCFDRFDVNQLNVLEDGSLEDVCIDCALREQEEMRRRGNN